jgi:hypothetical protein
MLVALWDLCDFVDQETFCQASKFGIIWVMQLLLIGSEQN